MELIPLFLAETTIRQIKLRQLLELQRGWKIKIWTLPALQP